MPIDPITVAMLTALTTPPFADRSLRAKLNRLLTGKDAYSYQLEDAWKAGRRAFVETLGTLGYETGSLEERLEEMFGSAAFREAVSRLPVHDPATIDIAACAEHFYARVLPKAMEETFEHAWRALVMRFHGTVSQSPELKNLIDLSREARRDAQDAERDARDEVKVETLGRLEDLVGELLAVVQRTAQPVEAEARLAPALRSYLEWVRDDVGALWLSGIDPALKKGSEDLRLDAVYTALLTGAESELDPERRPDKGAMRELEAKKVPALEQLRRHDRLVLLGDPGSGKSTFVQFVALCMAGELAGDGVGLSTLTHPLPDEEGNDLSEPQPWDRGALVPLRVVLRDFAARGLPAKGEASAKHVWSFVCAELAERTLDDAAPRLKEKLRAGEVIVLFDGLDEVDEADRCRERLVGALSDFAGVYKKSRYLVTCRTYAYQDPRWQLRDFRQARLQPWERGQIRRFVDRWYEHAAQLGRFTARKAEKRADDLKRTIETSDSLGELARWPLLLALMASLHAWREGRLPEGRVELYEQAVDLLLELWQEGKTSQGPDGEERKQQSLTEYLKVGKKPVLRQLEKLAYRAHASQKRSGEETVRQGGRKSQRTADIARKDLLDALYEISGETLPPQQLMRFLSDRAGLLVERKTGVFSFVHRSFQEYLAARHLLKGKVPDDLARHARTDPDRWREVTLLAAASLAEVVPDNVWALVRALLMRRSKNPSLKAARVAHLAGQALHEAGLVASGPQQRKPEIPDRRLFDRLRRWQLANLTGTRLPARDRAQCGRNLARFGELRDSVLDVLEMEWCWVPAGRFRLGTEKGWGDEKPVRDYEVPYGYWLSRFPITQALYCLFVEAGGYREERYWIEAREHGRWDGTYLDDGEPVDGPSSFGGRFALPNHPVVGVSWYEARAFCRWLSERLGSVSLLPEGWEVDLPSEPEWEKAARGGERIPVEPVVRTLRSLSDGEPRVEDEENPDPDRLYPWGGKADPEKMNVDATEIGSTNAVGCFVAGASVYACEEMSGNVWEWTRSQYGEYPYPDVGKAANIELSPDADASLVLRGGGFPILPDLARCSDRDDGFRPWGRGGAVGFRPVLRPSAYLYL